MKVILNVPRNIFPDRKEAGDTVEINDNLALRWINAGIAHWPEMKEMSVIQGTKVKSEYTKKCKPTSIIIPVCNCLQYLKKCLDSVYKYTNNYEVIIIDNGSNSETKKYISELDQFDLKIITNSENKGFGYGNNQGIKVAEYDFLCFLNSDTLVTLDWLYKLQKAFKVNKDCGFTSPTTCYCGGIQCDQSLSKNRFAISELEVLAYCSSLKEEFIQTTVMGYCMLAKKELFEKVGVFDYKRYGIGSSEEVDLEWRAEQFGYKNYWAKGAYVHHYGHMTFTENGINPWDSLSKNRKIFLERKNDPNLFIENDVEIGVVRSSKLIRPTKSIKSVL